MKLLRFNKEVTFIDSDGNQHMLTIGSNITEEQFTDIYRQYVNGTLEDETVLLYIYPEIAEKRKIAAMFDTLINSGDFYKKDGALYKNNIPVSLPQLMIESYYEAYTEQDNVHINALNNFWTLCALNPDPQARQDLFPFLQRNGFTITQSGYFIGYRNVDVHNAGDKELHDFVYSQYTRIKNIKKNPSKYWVIEIDGMYSYVTESAYLNGNYEGNPIGTVQDLYDNPTWTQTVYTDRYTGTFRIRMKEPVKIKRSKCDPNPNNLCSRGLHIGAADWLERNYYGTNSIMVLVNPMNVVATPSQDFYGKMRVCEYYPMGIVEWENGQIIRPDTTVFENDYTDYVEEELQKMLEEADISELSINNFDLSEVQFNAIQTNLEKATEVISNRINTVETHCEKCGTALDGFEALAGICEMCFDEEE